METQPVLIAGAGPTGLLAACELSRRNIPFRIIDKNDKFTNLSRAILIQARTLEVFDQMGIAGKAVESGRKLDALQIVRNGKLVSRANIGDIGGDLSPFPFLFVLSQDRTEQILHESMEERGGRVEWKTKLETLREDDGGVQAVLSGPSGREEAGFSYVIGADGAHSAVRNALGIDFVGAPYEQVFFLADARLDWEIPGNAVTLAISPRSFAALIPMPGDNRYRILGILPPEYHDRDLSLADIRAFVAEYSRLSLSLSEPRWIAQYRLHHRCAANFSSRRVFLCGDAAHIHSPAGGQGMNTGLQDAYNLCWKLSMVVKGTAAFSILSTYEKERRPFAQWLLKSTDRLFMRMTGKSLVSRISRSYIVPLLAPVLFRLRVFRKTAFRFVSQIRIRYRESGLSAHRLSDAALTPGDRLPYAQSGGENIFRFLRSPNFVLLCFCGMAEAESVRRELGPVKHVCDIQILDPMGHKAVVEQYGARMILVRPDQYIALAAKEVNSSVVLKYFAEILQ